MPYINDTAPRGCERCEYFQKETHWCLRYNCVQDNMARAQKWKEERAAQISAAMAHIDHRGESWLEMARKRKERMAAMFEAYNSTSSDGEAARMLCMSLNTFRYWRQTSGLKSKYERNAKHGTRLTPEEHARRIAAYNATTSDSKAAALVGLSSKAFSNGETLPD